MSGHKETPFFIYVVCFFKRVKSGKDFVLVFACFMSKPVFSECSLPQVIGFSSETVAAFIAVVGILSILAQVPGKLLTYVMEFICNIDPSRPNVWIFCVIIEH